MIDLRRQLGDQPGAILTPSDVAGIWQEAFEQLAAVDPDGKLKAIRAAMGALSLIIVQEVEIERALVEMEQGCLQ